jgi:hypothetical protein
MVEYVNWCFEISELTLSDFQHKCFSGYCYILPRKSNPQKGNVYAIGHVLLGLLREKDYQDYLAFAELHKPIECFLDKKQSTINSYMKFSTLCVRKKTITVETVSKKIKRKRGTSSLLKLPPIPVAPREKHPLTSLAFAPKRNIKSLCNSLKGKCGIYCIYSKDFTTYIGQSIDVGKRLNQHIRKLNSSSHSNSALQSAWLLLGQNAFTFHLIEECETKILDDRERYYIEKYKTYIQGYNQTPDGQGTFSEDFENNKNREWLNHIKTIKKEENKTNYFNENNKSSNDSPEKNLVPNLNKINSKKNSQNVIVEKQFGERSEHSTLTFATSTSEEKNEALRKTTVAELVELRNKIKRKEAIEKQDWPFLRCIDDSTKLDPLKDLNQNHSKEKLQNAWLDDQSRYKNEHQIQTFLASVSEDDNDSIKINTTADLIELRKKIDKNSPYKKIRDSKSQFTTCEIKPSLPETGVEVIHIQTSFQELLFMTNTRMFVMSKLLKRITGLTTPLYKRYQKELERINNKYNSHYDLFTVQQRRDLLALIRILTKRR